MRLPRPRSLTSWMILGLLLLVVPLAFALTQAVTQLRHLADETDSLVRQGVELAGQAQALFRHLSAYDRATNLYLLLSDPRLLEASRSAQQMISETTDQLAALPLADDGTGIDPRALQKATVGDADDELTGETGIMFQNLVRYEMRKDRGEGNAGEDD